MFNNQTRRQTTLGSLAGMLALLAAGAVNGEELLDVSLGLSSASFATAPVQIAQELGLYEKNGLKPKFVKMESGSLATTALISGSVNFSVTGPSEIVVAGGRGQSLVVVANVYDSYSGSVVLSEATIAKLGVSPNAPVAERLKALNGVTIASPSATSTYTFSLKGAVEATGAKVNFTYMSQTAMASALQTGAIQGYIASAPFWATPVVRKFGQIWINGPKGEFPAEHAPGNSMMAVQATKAFAQQHPDTINKIRNVISDVSKAIEERPAEVKAAVAKLYPDLDAATLDLLFESERQGWKADPMTAQNITDIIQFVKANGQSLPQLDRLKPEELLYSK